MPSLGVTLNDNSAAFADSGHVYEFSAPLRGKRSLTLLRDSVIEADDSVNLDREAERNGFAHKLNGSAEVVERELTVLARELRQVHAEPNDDGGRHSQATKLVGLAIANGAELFHDATGEAYVSFPVDGHCETHGIRTKSTRMWLSKLFYDVDETVPGSQATNDALQTLEGQALYAGVHRDVAVRLAAQGDNLYLDLGDDEWRVVEITAPGWRIVPSHECPVKFRRPPGMLPLPDPDINGTVDDLRPLMHVGDGDDFKLIVGWLLGVFNLIGARPLLELLGEQGCGKTHLARELIALVDPCAVPMRTTPRQEDDLIIAARNRLIVAYDNLSSLAEWQSDALCRLSTGGGISKRELYSDKDEVQIDAQRPVLLTGINSVATRSDLLDRALSVSLPYLQPADRKTERELAAAFAAARPGILGGLLTAVSAALANRDAVAMARVPRLADFVTWVEAAAPALGWGSGEFLAAFEGSRRKADAVAIEALPIGPVLLTFMQERDEWEGTASVMLKELGKLVDDETKRDGDWPKGANRLSKQIGRLAPNLRQVGVSVAWQRSGPAGTRLICLSRNPSWDGSGARVAAAQPGEQSPASTVGSDDANGADGPAGVCSDKGVEYDVPARCASRRACARVGPCESGWCGRPMATEQD